MSNLDRFIPEPRLREVRGARRFVEHYHPRARVYLVQPTLARSWLTCESH